MLQDKYLPQSDVRKAESIEIHASLDRVYDIVDRLTFERSKIIYWLFKLRGIPVPESLSLKGLEQLNFVRLDSQPREGIIIGLIGQLWTPTGQLQKFSPGQFVEFQDPPFAKATWSFELTPLSENRTLLSTETRVLCSSADKRKKFMRYWKIIEPFSSWIRRIILRMIRDEAQRAR